LKRKSFNAAILSAIIFLVKLNVLAIPLYLITFYGLSYEPLQVAIATMTKSFLNAIGYDFAQQGSLISGVAGGARIDVQVSWDSTGWKSLYVITILALATPGIIWRSKMRFLAIALPAIFAANFVRIITTLLISFSFGMQYFDIVHELLWSAGMIAVVLGIWAFWLHKKRIIFTKTKSILGPNAKRRRLE
jgi:exosortase/archaeosortase family protein